MKNKLLLIILIFLSTLCLAQFNKEADSILTLIRKAEKTEKIKKYKLFFENYNADTSYAYGKIIDEAKDFCNSVSDKENELFFCITKGEYLMKKNYFETAKNIYDSCIYESKKFKFDKTEALAYQKLGELYTIRGEYEKALKNFYLSAGILEKINDEDSRAIVFNFIGMIYIDLGQNEKAIDFFTNAKNIIQKDEKQIHVLLTLINNIGVAYDNMNESQKALENYLEIYTIAKEKKLWYDIILAALNIGDSYRIIKKYNKAIEFTNICLDYCKKYNEKHYYYFGTTNLAQIYNETGNYSEALNLLKSVKDSVFLFDNQLGTFYLELLSSVYYNLGKYKESSETYKEYIALKDSVYNTEVKMQAAKLMSHFEAERKEKDILLLKKENQLGNVELKRQTLFRNSFIIGFLLMLLLAFSVFKAYRTKKKDNILLEEKNCEINEQKEEILQQNAVLQQQKEEIEAQRDSLEQLNSEIVAQRDLVTQQKSKIEFILNEQTCSIRYAEKIQFAVPPSDEEIKEKIPFDFFILFKPKDIVSGDFYFIEKRKNILLIAVADCTGHGVPGGFMSMLGTSFLNEIIARENIISSAQVLEELRDQIIHSLKQKEYSDDINTNSSISLKDGMDISFCAINTETLEMQFAGANNPLWIVRSPQPPPEAEVSQSENLQDFRLPTGDFQNIDSELPPDAETAESKTAESKMPNSEFIEIKGDKQPIGIYENMKPFTNHSIQLTKGDTIYLFSDGFQDQLGGPSQKRFLSKRFKQLISDNIQKNMSQQKIVFEQEHLKWKNFNNDEIEQTDDVTVFGFRI